MTNSASELRSVVGDDQVREGEPGDAIDGVQPRFVVTPASPEEVSALMSLASRSGLRVAPRGGGTTLDLGNVPTALDLVLDMTRMNRVLEHAAGDLVTSVEAGVRLQELQGTLAGAGQMLALDGYGSGATAGGVIAANTAGPRRLRYGTVRDLLIGITIVLPDGTIAKAGGKVVKNVAGYDLSKLMTGSLGTLGVIVKAIFRLHPRPAARRLVIGQVQEPEAVEETVQRILHSNLVPTAIHLSLPSSGMGRIGLLLEGVEPSVAAQSTLAETIFGPNSAPLVAREEEIDARWSELTATAVRENGLDLKVTCLPAALGEVITTIRGAASIHRGEFQITGPVGNGILNVHLDATDPVRASAMIHTLRSAIKPGHVTVLSASPEVKRAIDVWGPLGDTEALMRRVKDRFDPDYILNPGRFVGGI